ncbi:hypothetical protein FNF27_06391 [Cafeteria roenbergensis]|uniref:Uncharacterized protein n=1 Tax=Cafeteria roenbergensis TaxID=33653 RepID=A0A5A8E0I0_CAFRO|nr:hypothetical protein FNF27_06391 [Cafeteria roenbergensis]
MTSISERWHNASIARDTASILRSHHYTNYYGAVVDMFPADGAAAEVAEPPHFSVMRLPMLRGMFPTIVGVATDMDAITAACRLVKELRTAIPAAWAEGPLDVRAETLGAVEALVRCGAAAAPAPRERPGRRATDPAAPRYDGRIAVLASISATTPGGWTGTGAVGTEEDLYRRTDAGQIIPTSPAVRAALPLQEAACVTAPRLRVFREPAAAKGPASTATSSGEAAPSHGLMAAPIGVGFVGTVPPATVTADRSLLTGEATAKPDSRRGLLRSGYAMLAAAAAAGMQAIVVDPVGMGGAGCSVPAVAAARVLRTLLFQYFPGVFRVVLVAAGGAGVPDATDTSASKAGGASAGAGAGASDYLAGSGDGMHSPEDVVDTALALLAGSGEALEELLGFREGAAGAAAAAGGAAAGAGSSSMEPDAAADADAEWRAAAAAAAAALPEGTSEDVRSAVRAGFSPEFAAWGLTSRQGRGAVPTLTADPESHAARSLALLPALLPSEVALHQCRAALHVFCGSCLPLPAPATTRLRHALGLDVTPPESSIVRRRTKAAKAEAGMAARGAASGVSAPLATVGGASVVPVGSGGKAATGGAGAFSAVTFGGYEAPAATASLQSASADGVGHTDDEVSGDRRSFAAGPEVIEADQVEPDFFSGAVAFSAPSAEGAAGDDMI